MQVTIMQNTKKYLTHKNNITHVKIKSYQKDIIATQLCRYENLTNQFNLTKSHFWENDIWKSELESTVTKLSQRIEKLENTSPSTPDCSLAGLDGKNIWLSRAEKLDIVFGLKEVEAGTEKEKYKKEKEVNEDLMKAVKADPSQLTHRRFKKTSDKNKNRQCFSNSKARRRAMRSCATWSC